MPGYKDLGISTVDNVDIDYRQGGNDICHRWNGRTLWNSKHFRKYNSSFSWCSWRVNRRDNMEEKGRLVCVVPVYNESDLIVNTIESLKKK